ncbi:MAG: MOSC domain-containing protein [Gammaproteobacteria bacterium]|nr:MOSC domain-containing protein [Gammaproteobacteria bacterium]
MSQSQAAGSIAGIWRFPVKSMKGERVCATDVTQRGMVGDRANALIDKETGKVVSAKSVRHFPDLFGYQAAYVESPQAGQELPAVRISLPDGSTVDSSADNVDRVLSDSLGRDVTLAHSAPDDFTIDMYHPDIEDADPRGRRNSTVEQKLGSAFFDEAGMDSPVARESFFDLFPVTVLTTSTLDELRRLQPKADFDERRFRMNLIIDANTGGFIENDWIEREVVIGDSVRLVVTMPDPRCIMTTLAQDELPRDNEVLRTLVQHNRLPVAGAGAFPCAGVYAVITGPGTVSVGDDVVVADAS